MKAFSKIYLSRAAMMVASLHLASCATTSSAENVLTSFEADASPNAFIERDWRLLVPQLTDAIRSNNVDLVSNFMAPCLNIEGPNIDFERRCSNYYSQVIVLDEAFSESLKAWVKTEPNNVHANLFESYRLNTEGWVIRGHGTSNRVHPRHMGQYQEKLRQAAEHASRAIELNPGIPFGYEAAIDAYGSMGRAFVQNRDEVVQRSLVEVPWSYMVATTRISRSQPRWGGSYDAMEAIASEYEAYYPRPEGKDLSVLEAQILAIKASDWKDGYEVEQDYVLADAALNIVRISDYDRSHVLRNLAGVYAATDRGDQAKELMQHALEKDPYSESSLSGFMCLCNNMDSETAIRTTERYVDRFPVAYEGWLELGILRTLYTGDFQSGLDAYETARTMRPYEPELVRRINVSRGQLGLEKIDTETVDHQKGLLIYAYNNFAHVEAIKAQVKQQLGPQYGVIERQVFEQRVDDYFQLDTFDQHLRQQLDVVDLTLDDWQYIAQLVAIESNISDLSRTRIEEFLGDIETPERQALLQVINQALGRTSQAMVDQFLKDYNSKTGV
ncbi:tetratricopeptide repeat protein [Saccharospirillum alexandrii]|uniref:tetratricopeptide repeat protein n=1 Tax=Saccharospirillum alexandrii TaxID=2448477 RepID=UPI003735AD6F